MRNNIDATILGGNALTIRVLIEIFSSVNQTKKTEIQKIYDFLWLWSKKVHFLWLFIAIKFELSFVITFMAFYDCVRTLHQPFNYWRAHHVYYVASQPRTSDRLVCHWRALCLLAYDNWRCSIQPEIFHSLKCQARAGIRSRIDSGRVQYANSWTTHAVVLWKNFL